MNNVVVDHKPLEKQFLEHLELQGNHRVLFTAPFGQGKTTFLNEVFKETADKALTHEISKHFRNKREMRKKIVPFNMSIAMPHVCL